MAARPEKRAEWGRGLAGDEERERRWRRWRQRSEQVSAILPRRGGAIGLPQIRQLWTASGRAFRFSVFIVDVSRDEKNLLPTAKNVNAFVTTYCELNSLSLE